jgi:hypothetical protein
MKTSANTSKRAVTLVLVFRLMAATPGLAVGQTLQSEGTPPGGDPWPRQFSAQAASFKVYQPQVDRWTGNQLTAYAAIALKSQLSDDANYGVIWFTARTEVDKVNRVVTLDDFKLTRVSFPSLRDNGKQYASALQANIPLWKTMPLDLLETSLATTAATEQQKRYPLQNQPPNIIFSSTPAVLALVDGMPVLRPAQENLQKVINTRALIVFDPARRVYDLALMDGWVEAPTIQGPWSPAAREPKRALDRIRQNAEATDENQVLGNPEQSLRQAEEDREMPAVYVATVPAELLLTQGPPQLSPIPGTNLIYVENSGNDIFMDSSSQLYYILLAGRWFDSASLQNGPWQYVPGDRLPYDFSKIPAYSPKASLLVSIPGTPQAREALIANQIPQTAAISRTAAKLQVKYEGAPVLAPIQDTEMTYATNTVTPVVYVPGSNYFAVQDGVWFTAASATGPWTVAPSVPPVIYTIPPSSPIHYVTYAYVYGSTPTDVYVGYTPGYYGTVVSSDGLVVYGTGWNYPPYIGASTWVPAPYTYGVGAAFSWSAVAGWGLGFGLGMAIGSTCSPWWGPVGGWDWGYSTPAWGWGGYGGAAAANVYGRWGNTAYAGTHAAWANPYTGNLGRATRGSYYNPVTGNTGIGARGANYNAYTGNYRTRGYASGFNPTTGKAYRGAGGTVSNAYTGNYAAGARGSTYNPETGIVRGGAAGTVGNAYTGQAVTGSRGYAYNTNTGNGVAHAGNNVFADHDGNIYRASGSGWQQRASSGWSSLSDDSMRSSLNSWQSARGFGDQRWGNFRSGGWGGGWGGGGWADRGFGGGGFRSGGFGGFRGGGFRR